MAARYSEEQVLNGVGSPWVVRWSSQTQSTAAFFVLTTIVLLGFFSASAAAADPWVRHTIDNTSWGADGIRLADVNGDHLLDMTTGWEVGGLIRVYLNPGPMESKNAWPAVTVGEVQSPEDAVFVDLDGDGATDVVSSCEGQNRTIFVHWAPTAASKYLDASAWTTAAIPCTEKKQSWMFAMPLQVDGRHGVDIVVGSKGSQATIGWLEAPPDARRLELWKFHPLYQAGWIMSLQPHDIDNDGDQDVLASDRKGANRGLFWLENPGPRSAASGAAWTQHPIGAEDREVMFLSVSHDDRQVGDHRRDIFCAVKGRGISWFRSKETPGAFAKMTSLPIPNGYGTGKGVAVGDMDSNGTTDLVFSCEYADGELTGMGWFSQELRGQSIAWRAQPISGPSGVKFDRVELLDLDGDEDLDVITCEEQTNLGVIWYENPMTHTEK